jgi:hypothetical protein
MGMRDEAKRYAQTAIDAATGVRKPAVRGAADRNGKTRAVVWADRAP